MLQVSKNIVLQWGELPTSVAYIGTGQIMGWGNKAIEIRSVETGHLDGVFMHKKAQKLKFLCERNDKVSIVETASSDNIMRVHMKLLLIKDDYNKCLSFRAGLALARPFYFYQLKRICSPLKNLLSLAQNINLYI